MDYDDAFALDHDFARRRQRYEGAIVIATNCLDGSNACELGERGSAVDVACVHDQLNASHHIEDPLGKPVDELWAVSVRDDTDECCQTVRASTAAWRMV